MTATSNVNHRARVESDAAVQNHEPPAQWVALDSLLPWDENPRKNDGEPVARVARSIKRFGFGAPILARLANREIIAGHTRWKAAKLLGITEVPVRFLDLSESDAHLLAIADNRLNELTKWDDTLGDQLSRYSFDDAHVAGFDVDDVGKYLQQDPDVIVQELDASDLHDKFWLTVQGPVTIQPEVLKTIRAQLGAIDGVTVEVRYVEED